MKVRIFFAIVLTLAFTALLMAQAAAPAAAPARAAGVVTAIDAAAKQITIKTDAGADMTLLAVATTKVKRVPPSLDATKATEIAFTDIVIGDRVTAAGKSSPDGKSATVSTVYVLTKDDIVKKQEADQAEWQRRGVGGSVTSVDAAAKQIAINARQPDGSSKPLVIVITAKTRMRRYSPDSIKFSDAKPGTFADLAIGDQVRALGTRSEDGAQYAAEDVVSGAFRSLAATVVSVDEAGGVLKLKDLDTKGTVTVKINADSNLRAMPPQTAATMAARYSAMADAAAGRGGAQSGPPAGAGGQGGGRGAGRGGGDMQQMIDRMPQFKLNELKPGDALIISGAKGADPAVITAITIIKGVEPILSATPASQRPMVLGNWSTDVGGGGGVP